MRKEWEHRPAFNGAWHGAAERKEDEAGWQHCKSGALASSGPSHQALEAQRGSGRRRPSFSVPRLCRGVHRPAAAALRALARGHVLGGWPGLGPAAAVARLLLAGRWPGCHPVWPRAAARPVTSFGPYLPEVAISDGPGAGQFGFMGKTAAAQRMLALLVRLYC